MHGPFATLISMVRVCKKRPRDAATPPALQHPAPPLRNGVLALTDESSVWIQTRGVVSDPGDWEEMWHNMPPPTLNPRNNKTFLKRRQCTYGDSCYRFGKQVSKCQGTLDAAPCLVRKCVAYAKQDAAARWPDIPPEDLTVAHCNFYDGGGTGLDAHQDVEPQNANRPIWSFTFIAPDKRSSADYRYFGIYSNHTGRPNALVAALGLRDGDVLVMQGKFQQELWHGVPKTSRSDMKYQQRINVTVRAWGPLITPERPASMICGTRDE